MTDMLSATSHQIGDENIRIGDHSVRRQIENNKIWLTMRQWQRGGRIQHETRSRTTVNCIGISFNGVRADYSSFCLDDLTRWGRVIALQNTFSHAYYGGMYELHAQNQAASSSPYMKIHLALHVRPGFNRFSLWQCCVDYV